MENKPKENLSNIIEKNSDNQTLNLAGYEDKIQLVFDYEMNNTRLEEDKNNNENSKILYFDEIRKEFIPINYDSFVDKLKPLPKMPPPKQVKGTNEQNEYDADFEEIEEPDKIDDVEKANLFKRLVSKQKRRYQDAQFDLDMSYITDRVIAMGYPSTGMETIYRNALQDVIRFFNVKHNDEVKVYNLCLEKDRIYDKSAFPNSKVGLFPANDHNPSPIKLILEFCIDICLYLMKNPKGVAAVHCKAGKGRTGVMICAYLVFSGLCKNCEQAFRHYARIRTKNNKGVTIASQRRYIKYFENFLKANFYQPYIKLIPKIIRSQFSFLIDPNNNVRINNILQSFQKEESYFISANKFKLKGLKFGPLPYGKELKLKVCNFIESKFELPKKHLMDYYKYDIKGGAFYEQYFNPELDVHSDIKIQIKKDINFYLWVNFWYSTIEMVKNFSNKYQVRLRKQINSVQDIVVKDLVSTKKTENKYKKKITSAELGNFSENNEVNNEENSLYDLIQSLKSDSDLNELINKVNENCDNYYFDKENMSIKVSSTDFDKFQEKKDYDPFEMIIFYSLSDN